MRGDVRKIDPNLNLGLHELANTKGPGSFSFQLQFVKQQIEDILLNLDNLVRNTVEKVPNREKNFCLNRTTNPPLRRGRLSREEDKWERAMFGKWGLGGSGEYVAVCKRIQTYQYPLKSFRGDRCWGRIDLLGIGPDFLPVPNELKTREASESPLRMLVEVAAYGFAIQKAWPKLKDHWVEAMRWLNEPPPQFPATLDRVTLIGVAPDEYWSRCLGRLPRTNEGKFPSEAWPPFWELVDALGRWFDIHFVAIEGSWNETGLPTITGARVLDLRSDSCR